MYREYAARPGVAHVAACTWQHLAEADLQARVVPDACVDIIWDGSRLSVAGPDTRPVDHALAGGTRLLGLRFVPGSAGAMLGVPASAVRDAQVELCELWGDEARVLVETLAAAGPDEQAARDALECAVARKLRAGPEPDALAGAVVRALRPPQPNGTGVIGVPRGPALARALGVSERQLRRRCAAAVGYGPKLLARVLRFQALRARIAQEPERSLAELAAELGYVDQAHMGHDVMALAGLTPAGLRG